MSDLLSIPLKNTCEIDWTKPLQDLFQAAGHQNLDLENSIEALNNLRSQVTSGKLERSQVGVDAISRYYDQITALETRFSGGAGDSLKINFTWEDAFDKGTLFGGKVSTSLPFLQFERFCVLFNVGSFLSQLAAEHQLANSDEEMKMVAKWFQTSSGIFAHLSSSIGILSSETLSPDIQTDCLDSLSALMLAQAQEIFVTKAIKDKMKDALVAKLCTQTDDMYADALIKMTKENVKFQWDRTWLNNISGKQLAFAGLAQYFQSRACFASKRIGEQIARLNLCIETLTKAQTKMGNTTLFSFYITEANRLVVEAKKDNDFIYHEQIPHVSNLSSIDKVPSARLAKPTNISQQDHLSPNFTDLFSDLKPKVSTPSSDEPVRPPRTKRGPDAISESKSNTESAAQASPNPNSPSSSGSNQTPVDTPTTAAENIADTAVSPLKQAVDASLYAVGYYMKQYLGGGGKQS